MLRFLNFRVLLLCALFTTTLFINSATSQVTAVDYLISYDEDNCVWDFNIIIETGNATTAQERVQFNSQYSFVVPTGTSVGNIVNHNPIQLNNNYTGTAPTVWDVTTPATNPAAAPGFDFWSVQPALNPASFFNNLTEGDTIKLFSLEIGVIPNCEMQIRPFDNLNDPGSDAPGMGGGNFSNGYTIGGSTQDYNANREVGLPDPPALSAVINCSDAIEIDLTASTVTCLEPLSFSWTGPGGYTGTDEDVFIPNATAANVGTYMVTVTNSFGCTSELQIEGEIKPDAGIDSEGCASSSIDLQGAPTNGTWTSDPTNSGGATLVPGSTGAAQVDFDGSATGTYSFIYSGQVCSDSTIITIVTPDAGADPDPIGCFSAGTASISAVGTGTWSIGAGSAGTAMIDDNTSASTTVTGFSEPGTYFLVWDIGACSDTVTIVTNDNCLCAISNNSLAVIDPNTFCGTSGNIVIDGGAVTNSGSYLWEYNLNGATFSAAPGTNNTEDYTTLDLTEGTHSFRRLFNTDTGILCSDTSNVVTFTVNETPGIPQDIQALPDVLCENETSMVTVTNNPFATYTWSVTPTGSGMSTSTSNSVTLDPTEVGIYTVSVFQTVDGCPGLPTSIDVTVFEVPPTPQESDFTVFNPSACATTDGEITISGLSPSTEYTVNYDLNGVARDEDGFSNSSGIFSIPNLGAGVYTNFEIVSTDDCPSGIFGGPITLTEPSAPSNPTGLTATPNPECLGQPIEISVDDVSGAIFNWSASSPNAGLGASNSNTVLMNATAPGLYTIFVSLTLNGCTSIDTFTSVLVNDSPVTPTAGSVSGSDPSVCGGNDGSITLSGYEPSASFDVEYSLNGNPTTVTLNSNSAGVITIVNLTEGTYSDFVVNNFTGCASGTFPGPISLADPGSPDAPANLTATLNPLCLGEQTTLSVASIIGGSFNWSASSPDAGLASGTGNSILMTPTAAGTYTINVSVSVAGCTSPSSSIVITVGDTPATPANLASTDPTACSGLDGTITIQGYTPNVMYSVEYSFGPNQVTVPVTANGSGELLLVGLASGTYTGFSVSNAADCSSGVFAGPISLVDPDAPDAPTGMTIEPNPICQGETVTISVPLTSGAEYSWSVIPSDAGFNADNTNQITFTPSTDGLFAVSVSQTINGCVSGSSAPMNVIVSPSPPSPDAADVSAVNPLGCQESNGSISIAALDANVSYGIQFDSAMVTINRVIAANSSGVVIISDLASGSYSNFILTNEIGCSSSPFAGPVTLSDPGSPDAPSNLTATPNPVCLGETVNLSVTNNSGAVFTWSASSPDAGLISDDSNTTTMTATAAGTYTIVVSQNLAGCVSPSSMIEVIVSDSPPSPTASTVIGTDPSDCGQSNGSITISGLDTNASYTLTFSTNGTPTTNDFISNAQGEIVISNLGAATYSDFGFTNSAGCNSGVFAGPVVLSEPNAPDAPTGLVANPNPICLGETIELSAAFISGATYNWVASSPDAGLLQNTSNQTSMTPTVAGNYTISVSLTLAGCESSNASIEVVVNPGPITPTNGTVIASDPTSCTSDDGTISLSGYENGETYELDYTLNGSPNTVTVTANSAGEITLSSLPAGTYAGFQVTNTDGCSSGVSPVSVVLEQPGAPNAPQGISGAPNPVCFGNEINLSVFNIPFASYEWTADSPDAGLSADNGNTATMNATLPGTYTISVTQTITGCTSAPSLIRILVIDDCLNPDFGVTYDGIQLSGDLNTNDKTLPGTTYGNVNAMGSNPTSTLPIVASDGTYTFESTVPGEYYFMVQACRPNGGCITKPLAITILDIQSTENAPVANHDYILVLEDTPIEIPIRANDKCQSFPNCSFDPASIITGPFGGTFNTTTEMYTPNAGFVGRDSFVYEVCQDPTTPQSCDQEWVYINILPSFATDFTNGMDDYNQAPLNGTLTVSAAEGLLANDQDAGGNAMEVTPGTFTETGKGTLVLNADGSYVFTPVLNYIGPVDFPYTVCRGNNNAICDNATLHLLVETMAATGSIGSCVWEDSNGNGIFEPGEPSIANIPVSLYTADGLIVAETVTDGQGNYQFDDILAGIYFLRFEEIDAFEFTLPNVGNETNDSDVDDSNGPGTTALLTLDPGQFIDNVKAGLYECTRIGDNVWYDVNENDLFDVLENGINGMRVYLYRRVNGQWVVWAETTTGQKPNSPSDDGWYEFCTAPGEYYVEIILPPTGLVQAVPNVGNNPFKDSDINNANGRGTTSSFTLVNGINKLDLGAGYYPEAVVGNLVWHDEDFNGIQNVGEERIAGVRVEAFDAVTLEPLVHTYTDENGEYMLDSLDKREVFYKFTPPSQYVATVPGVANDMIDSDVDHTYGINTTRMFSIQPNTLNDRIDFGVALGALPVKWVSVNVVEEENDHKLVWEVEQEVNVAHYNVQSRHESQNEFSQVNEKSIESNDVLTLSTYDYLDETVSLPGLYYYRVQQVDLDGKVNYSKTVSIMREAGLDTKLYPNPSKGRTNVSYNASFDGDIRISISDINGKVIKVIQNEVSEGFGVIALDLDGMLPGTYNVSIELNDQITNKRMIIIE